MVSCNCNEDPLFLEKFSMKFLISLLLASKASSESSPRPRPPFSQMSCPACWIWCKVKLSLAQGNFSASSSMVSLTSWSNTSTLICSAHDNTRRSALSLTCRSRTASCWLSSTRNLIASMDFAENHLRPALPVVDVPVCASPPYTCSNLNPLHFFSIILMNFCINFNCKFLIHLLC